MKNVIIESLSARHFKGAESLDINFKHHTFIYGDNGTGKTTVNDAFVWCLFGKDSQFKADFEIKPLDENNHPKEKVEIEVTICLNIDGEKVCLKRVQREKWQTQRGSNVAVLKGNETFCFVDDVPKTITEYKKYISDILDEKAFMMVTNISYFNTINWTERRGILTEMAGSLSNEEIIDQLANLGNKDQTLILTNILNSKRSFEDEKKRIAVEKKKANDELKLIPSRIDEAERAKPESKDWASIEAEIVEKEQLIKDCDAQLLDKSKGVEKLISEKNRILREIGDLESKKQARISEITTEANKGLKKLEDYRNEFSELISQVEKKIKATGEDIGSLKTQKDILVSDRQKQLDKWNTVNNEVLKFNDNDFVCPTCKRSFEDSDIDSRKNEMVVSFNKSKTERLDEIEKLGKTYTPAIESKDSQIKEREEALKQLAGQESKLRTEFINATNAINDYRAPDIQALINSDASVDGFSKMIEEKRQSIPEIREVDNSDILIIKNEANERLKELRKQLNSKDDITRQDMRISELKRQEKEYAQQVADYENIEFAIEKFTKAKMEAIERRVNSMFKYVRFKMFDTQLNGGEKETCDTLVNGVPYSDLNNAAKINAGLDIINALSKHYGIYAPVFIDNRESVNELIESECQIINLVVTKDESLKVG